MRRPRRGVTDMRESIVLVALIIVGVTYVWFSRRDGSWFNALTPQLFIAIPALYLAQVARLSLGLDDPASITAWAYVYACYCIPFLVFAWTLVHSAIPSPLKIRHRVRLTIGISPWICLGLGVLLYLPIAIEFRDNLLNPRAIYEQTRTGYGFNFFLSTLMSTLGFVLYLFKTEHAGKRVFFFLCCATLSLAHGSKGLVIANGMVWLLHWRYVSERRISFRLAVALMSLMAGALLTLFFVLSSGIELAQLGNFVIGYSDFTANGLMVIDNDKPAFWGRILFEDNVYSRIPRALFADKPKDFGSFYLAKLYFPESFDLDQGVPAFGIGAPFADFKWFTLPILTAESFFLALLTKSYRRSLRTFRHPGDFIVFMFLCGVPLFSIGVGFLLPEHLIIAALLGLCLRLRISWRRRSRPRNDPARISLDPADAAT
jgi:hypothetical protein